MAIHVVKHPLLEHKLSVLRDKETSTKKFRELVEEITMLLAYEATRELPLRRVRLETPVCAMEASMLDDERLVICPILRAGLGMVEGMVSLLPTARVAHIGLRRDEETKLPTTYYYNVPKAIKGQTVFVLDPMLATAGSLCAAIDLLKKESPGRIVAICLIGAPEGRDRVLRDHPDVDVYLGAMDERLNEKAYIVPGLGDAGDRLYGTV